MKTFFEQLKIRRSIRKSLSLPIESEKIALITQAALMSPASKRSNPWEFIVVQKPEMLVELSKCRPMGCQFLAEAPLAIVVIADTTKSDVWIEDAAIAATIIQLQAHHLGLGSCWIQVYLRQKDEKTSTEQYIKSLLGVPEQFAVLNIISIGYPNEEKKPHDEAKLETDKIHANRF